VHAPVRRLAFTGLPVVPMVVGGFGLVGAGLALRRRVRPV
jgi:hypothetical protein